MKRVILVIKTAHQLAKIAARARTNWFELQKSSPKENVPVGEFSERIIPSSAGKTRILIYKPTSGDAPYPVFINTHGGGFIMGSAEDDDVWCRRIANVVQCMVVSVDYRLAPEHKFPTALEECYDVIQWLCRNAQELAIDTKKIAVGGQSAGGNLAAGLCLLARERQDFSIIYQVLNYPPLDMTIDPHSKPALDKVLTARMQILFNACYFRSESDALNPLVSPLLARDLSGLPDALIIAAEYDPLRVEAEIYARRLIDAGVSVRFELFADCMHAFTHFGPTAASEAALQLLQAELRSAFRL